MRSPLPPPPGTFSPAPGTYPHRRFWPPPSGGLNSPLFCPRFRLLPLSAVSAPRANYRITALIVAAALFMEQMDATVLATALPTMAATFGVSPLHMSVALTAYLISLAVFIPASGKVADRFGARNVFRVAIVLFVLGSILCGQADSLPFLVVARFLQGMGGAMMMPVGRLVLLRTTAREDFVSAMAWLMVPGLVGPVLGPPLGGFIVTYWSWRWIFYINVPIGLLGLYFATRYIGEVREENPGPFDGVGFVLSGIALACLMFGLELASRGVLSVTAMVLVFGVGLSCAALYFRHARHTPAPILDFSLMAVPTFRLSVLGGSLARVTAGATPFLLPMLMQVGFGLSAAKSGLITFAGAAGAMAMKASATPILRRFGFRNTLIWNSVVSSACIALYATLRPDWPDWTIYVLLFCGGFFQSLIFTAYNSVAYADLPPARMSAATSFYTTFQQLMLSMGICLSAAALHASVVLSGRQEALVTDFSVAFLVVTAISLLAAPVCARIPKNAGSDMTGYQDGPD